MHKKTTIEMVLYYFQDVFSHSSMSYGIPYVAEIMQITAPIAGDLHRRTPMEALTVEIPDVYQYPDFGFYDQVWFKEDAGLVEIKLRRFLGVSHHIGSLMSYRVFQQA